MMEKKWSYKEPQLSKNAGENCVLVPGPVYTEGRNDGTKEEASGAALVLEQLLWKRGVRTREEQAEYLTQKPKLTYDPFLMKDMKLAVERIQKALKEEEHICIYGDYDADGVTACTLLLEILGKLTKHLSYYIPSRFDEGYGLNIQAIDAIYRRGAALIITVDCGSLSYEEVEHAKALGLGIIVTDHHTIGEEPAARCILLNPKQKSCEYPFCGLSGCGVAFKLAQALQRTLGFPKADLNKTLDLVAISTIGDVVPLVDENRTLVKYGLQSINKGGRIGLDLLMDLIGLHGDEIKSRQVAYTIVPHLNAAGRMLSAKTGVELLRARGNTPEEKKKQDTLANLLLEQNKERRRVQDETFETCLLTALSKHEGETFILLDAGLTHEGIAGIVAGKLKDYFFRPVALVTDMGDGIHLKGTARSVENVHLYELLHTQKHLLERFGGHEGACGFILLRENLQRLRQGLLAEMDRLLLKNPRILRPGLTLEGALEAEDLCPELLRELEKLEPYGQGNEKPLFSVGQLKITSLRYMGEQNQHVRFQAVQTKKKSDFILFGRAEEYRELLEVGQCIKVAGYPDENIWNGVRKMQFVVQDIKREKRNGTRETEEAGKGDDCNQKA